MGSILQLASTAQLSGGSIPLYTPTFTHFADKALFTYDPRTYANVTQNVDITLGPKAYQRF